MDGQDDLQEEPWSDDAPAPDLSAPAQPSLSPPADVDALYVYAPPSDHQQAYRDNLLAQANGPGWAPFLSGLRGFGDTATLGLLTPGIALGKTIFGNGDFRGNLAREQAIDQADAAAHPIAHNVGEAVGVLAPLAFSELAVPALGAAKGLGWFARAFAPTAELGEGNAAGRAIGHVVRTGAATGAASGVVGQGVNDAITGQGPDPANYAAALMSGGLGGALHPAIGGVGGGMVAGGSAPIFQAVLHGQMPNLQDIYSGALTGTAAGALANRAGEKWSNSLSGQAKGSKARLFATSKEELGERLSMADAYLRGYGGLQRDVRTPLSDYNGRSGYTNVDVVGRHFLFGFGPLRIESKFGPGARFTPRQRQAMEEGLLGYEPQWWLPKDVGGMAGAGLGAAFHQDDTRPTKSQF